MNTNPVGNSIRRILLTAGCCGAMLLGGCMTERVNLSMPGTIDVQRRRAIRLDPYPNQHIAPEIEGGRPRDYDIDRSETDRSKLLREVWWGWPF